MEETIMKILSLIAGLIAGWSLGYMFGELIEPILLKLHNETLKRKYLEQKESQSWTTSWTPYKTTITVECAVNDSIDERERDRLVKCLREQWESSGIRVTVKDEEKKDAH